MAQMSKLKTIAQNSKLCGRLIIIMVIVIYYMLHSTYSVAQSYSNTVRVKVGTQPETSDFAKAAQDVANTYKACTPEDPPGGKTKLNGNTRTNNAVESCTLNLLQERGYSGDFVEKFSKRRERAKPNGCVECLGFNAISLTLASGDTTTLLQNSPVEILENPSLLNSDRSSLLTYTRTDSDDIQPGDIGFASGCDSVGSAGHALIFKRLLPDTIRFEGIESSYPTTCFVNDAQTHPKDCYTFFRVRKK